MTVSRVINGGGVVKPETREAVDAAIAALGYAPNRAARLLAGGALSRFALLYSNPSAAYLSEFLLGSLDQARRSNVQLVVERCDPGDDPDTMVQRLISRGIDGVVLPPPLCEQSALLRALEAGALPTVSVAGGASPTSTFTVTIDDKAASQEMTRHLLALGHRRIAFVCGDRNQTAAGKRLEGYQAALRDADIWVDPQLIVPGEFTYRSGLQAAERVLDLAEPPSAIFASNDDMAAAAAAVAHRKGIDVPRQLTVVGFDDTAIATTISPELTTIRQPIAAMAEAALQVLTGAVQARRDGEAAGTPTRRLLMHALIRRGSDAPPSLP